MSGIVNILSVTGDASGKLSVRIRGLRGGLYKDNIKIYTLINALNCCVMVAVI